MRRASHRLGLCIALMQWVALPAPAVLAGTDDVTPLPPSTCISPFHPCVTVPVVFARADTGALRGWSVTVTLSPNLVLCGAGIAEGPYLQSVGLTDFHVIPNGGGSYTVDAALLGLPCGARGTGVLFTLQLGSPALSGTGTVTVGQVVARDCENLPLPAVPGPPALICIESPNVVEPRPPEACLSTADSCVAVPVVISRTDTTGLRAYSVTLHLGPELHLCGEGVREGPYLRDAGLTDFHVVPNGGGSYTVDAALLGLPCAAHGDGTLFYLDVGAAGPGGTATVTVDSVLTRDCDNGVLPAQPGAPSSFVYDRTPPEPVTGLTATQERLGNAAGDTTRVRVQWPAVESGATVLLYRAGFGRHPEYDDDGGSVPVVPAYPPGAPWTPAAVVTGGTSLTEYPGARDFWYYVAFVRDTCGNVSPVSGRTGGTLNYHLGDVSDGVAAGQGDNHVGTADISILGSHYATFLAADDPLAFLDVGPTTTNYVDGRPLTDNWIGFEDLMMFAINFGHVTGPATAAARIAESEDELKVEAPAKVAAGEVFEARLCFRGTGRVQGLSVRLAWDREVAEYADLETGSWLGAVGGVALSAGPGAVDAAVLGAGRGLVGSGELASLRFRATTAGAPRLVLAAVDARDVMNCPVALAEGRPVAPVATELAPPIPNPFRRSAALSFGLARAGAVELAVYGVDGRKVATLARGWHEPGEYRLTWDGGGERPGVYFIRLTTPEGGFTRELVLLK